MNNIGYTNLTQINLHPILTHLPILFTYLYFLFLLPQHFPPKTKGGN